ncbi:MAG TPA: protein kinase [Pyrinomonadaceae bacterium]|nr:protein kinase [Pyrinomonadaceae bacterium]
MNLKEGTTLGRYEIRALLGAGGMGEVYRAYDPKIAREVAVKVLPADFASDSDRVERLEREAQAAGGLNHPNILGIYDIDSQDGTYFVVSELLVGEELRSRLNEGSIPLRKTIDYAQQIVSGLAAAHERGVIHRDLKPENLFITKDDRVKILDFGLAKLREAPTNPEGSEDATKKALTDPGIVMGTVGYMSPEQVRGHAADQRSDIFSFGVILYEMLTGQRAFTGETVFDTMHSIVKEDVADFEVSGTRVSPAVEKVMRRCLEKNPDHRFHSAHDLGFALDAVASPTSSSGSGLAIAAKALSEDEPAKQSTWTRYAAWGVAALCLIAAFAFASLYFRRERPRADTMRFAIPPPEKSLFSEGFALSPDGKSMAFVARGTLGETSLWVRSLSSVDAKQLPGTDGAVFPFWSPDGKTIGFFAGNKLRKIEASGGPPQSLADTTADARGGAWSTDGTIIFSPNTLSPLMRISSSGGMPSEVTTLNAEIGQSSHRWPTMLPDGRHFLYFGRGGDIEKQGLYAASLDNPEPKFIVASQVSGTYAESNGVGYLLFVRERVLMVQRFDPTKLELSGDAVPMVERILAFPGEVGPTAYVAVSAAAGNLVYRTGDAQTTRLSWFDRGGKTLESITEPGGYHEPQLSRDGTKVLYSRNDPTGPQDVYLQDLVRGNTTRLTFDPAGDSTAVFSPDETQIVFFSNRSAKTGLYRKASNGSGNDEELFIDNNGIYPNGWSADGKYILCDRNGGPRTKVDLWMVPIDGGDPVMYLASEFEEGHAQFSPDGRWVAYTSNETGKTEVYIESFPRGNGKWQISTTGGDGVQWRSDGKELFYLAADNNLMAVTITVTSSGIDASRPAILFPTTAPQGAITDDKNNFAVSPDGQKFLINTQANTTNAQPITLVLNWANEMKK